MLLTVIVLYSFIIKFLKRDCDLSNTDESGDVNSLKSPSSNSSSKQPIFSNSSSLLTSIAYEKLKKNHMNRENSTSNEYVTTRSQSPSQDNNKNLSAKSPNNSDEDLVDDNNQDEDVENLNEEEFYNIIATRAAAFQSKRNSSTSTISSGSIFDESYRTKRNSLRSQSSTCSDIMETSSNRRLSEERIQNKKLNYKARRHGFTSLSKRRRTTGRYFFFAP